MATPKPPREGDSTRLSLPTPVLDGRFQPGITDPQWPRTPKERGKIDFKKYREDLSGRVDRQLFLTVVTADLAPRIDRGGLAECLRAITTFARREMGKKPSHDLLPYGTHLPESYRLTLTVGFGWKMFRDVQGNDRFGIDGLRPRHLKPMPPIFGDAPGMVPDHEATDLVFVISSDHPYVNVSVGRAIAHGYADPSIQVRRIEQGFGRPDKREFLRFNDGIENLRNDTDERTLDQRVYVHPGDDEPEWCVDGSYLVYRKIRENLPAWEHLGTNRAEQERIQEAMIGRRKSDGKPLSRQCAGAHEMTPVYSDPKDPRDGPLNAHIRKVQPRRRGADIFGGNDLDRRFLRRAYPYFSGLDAQNHVDCGLQFLAFMRDLRSQFEWVTHMWQMNPDFPEPGIGPDALFARGILSAVGGGFYFCPPASKGDKDFIGSALVS